MFSVTQAKRLESWDY